MGLNICHNAYFESITYAERQDLHTLSYSQTMMLDIYGKELEHTDQGDLVRVG